MVIKALLSLVLIIAVSTLAFMNGYGEGFFEFNSKSKAESALEEGRQIQDAMTAYAARFGDGRVDLGNPALGEDPLMYLKARQLLVSRVGDMLNSQIEAWEIDEDSGALQGAVKNEKICRYMNLLSHNYPIESPIPQCGEEENAHLPCCVKAET